ncbi:MAG: phytoene desaturase family protein, partial [Pigmentiphaga sp.]
ATPMVHLFGNGRSMMFGDLDAKLSAAIKALHPDDLQGYKDYRQHMTALGRVVSEMLWEVPPDIGSTTITDRARLLKLAYKYRALGRQVYDLYDILTLSAYDYLLRWFKSDEMITALGFYATCGGANTSLMSPGSAYVLLRGYIRDHTTPAGPAGFVRGGMGTISEAIAAAGKAAGMEIRCNAEVKRVIVIDGVATGVELKDGETLHAKRVVSNAATKVLFQQLVPAQSVSEDFRKKVSFIRDRSTAFKVNLAMKRLPVFKDFDPKAAGFDYPNQVRIAPSVAYLERAYDASKYGEISSRPPLVVLTPSAVDPTVAPPGKHLISILGQHAPYDLAGGDWDQMRPTLYETVLSTLEEYAPDIRDCIDDAQVLSPVDLERIFALPGGHVHHGELSMDQIFFRRPVEGAADYRTPIKNLFQCGASVHPGGGVTGVPGYNAAQVILSARG